MSDYLVRILTKSGSFRGLACVTTELVEEARQRHDTLPTATVALGRALTGGALLGALLKTGQRVGLKFEGNGPLGKIIVEARSNGEVVGAVGNPAVDLPPKNGREDVAGALGAAGFLTVTKDLMLREPYRGTVQLVSSEIAEDLAWYLTESEQVPSAVGLGVLVGADGRAAASGGFLVQSLPPQDEAAIDLLMERIGALPPLSEHFGRGGTPEQLLEIMFSGIPYDTLEKRVLAFRCTCSTEKSEGVLVAQGHDALADILDRDGEITVTCSFCGEVRRFDRDTVARLFPADSAVTAG